MNIRAEETESCKKQSEIIDSGLLYFFATAYTARKNKINAKELMMKNRIDGPIKV